MTRVLEVGIRRGPRWLTFGTIQQDDPRLPFDCLQHIQFSHSDPCVAGQIAESAEADETTTFKFDPTEGTIRVCSLKGFFEPHI